MTKEDRDKKIKALYSVVYSIQGLMSGFACKVLNPWWIELEAMSNGEIELYFGLVQDAIDSVKKE